MERMQKQKFHSMTYLTVINKVLIKSLELTYGENIARLTQDIASGLRVQKY